MKSYIYSLSVIISALLLSCQTVTKEDSPSDMLLPQTDYSYRPDYVTDSDKFLESKISNTEDKN